MDLSSFSELLDASHQQPEPQRLLFAFARIEVPEDANEAQRARTVAGEGGHLRPAMCVDKTPAEVPSFAALVEESERTGEAWDVVFVAAMSGRAGLAPTTEEAAQPLDSMIDAIKQGRVSNFAAFDREGHVLHIL